MNHLIKFEPIQSAISGLKPYEVDRLRRCPYCEKLHIVNNKSRDYCCDWCADTHYNQLRRLLNQASPKKSIEIKSFGGSISPIESNNDQQFANMSQETLFEKQINLNVAKLDSFYVEPNNGTPYKIETLANAEFDFNAYTSRIKLHNTPADKDCYYLVFRNYMLFWINENELLIKKIIN